MTTGYVMLPWQDEPLFVESEYADGRSWLVVHKPFRVPVDLIADFPALPPTKLFIEEVMLQREVIACGLSHDHVFVYRMDGDSRLEHALAMLNMAVFFVEQIKDIVEPLWRIRRNIDREGTVDDSACVHQVHEVPIAHQP
jgi:hypothetical protein